MKKIFLIFIIFLFSANYSFSAEEKTMVIPTDLTFTERYMLGELKDLRTMMESLKREIFVEIQAREMSTIDKALSYSANSVNFFHFLITILMTGIGVIGWKTIGDIKKSTKESIDRETKKIIDNFQEKISELEKEQKINILWRQFNSSEADSEKLLTLDKIYDIKPDSQYVAIERSNIYLSMGFYEKVIELTNLIINSDDRKLLNHALFNRACAYASLEDIENVIDDLKTLLQISPDYKDNIIENKHFEKILNNSKIKQILK